MSLQGRRICSSYHTSEWHTLPITVKSVLIASRCCLPFDRRSYALRRSYLGSQRALQRCIPKACSSNLTFKDTSSLIKALRQLAKTSTPDTFNVRARPAIDGRVDRLLSDFRALTNDAQSASSRELGQTIWALGKLATPSCHRHAAVLLHALASPPKLRDAPTLSLTNAVYASALLLRNANRNRSHSHTLTNSSAPASPTPASSPHATDLLSPALALAAACIPRMPNLKEQDLVMTWWAVAVLATSSPSISTVPTNTTATAPASTRDHLPTFGSSPTTARRTPGPCLIASGLPPGLLPALVRSGTRLLRQRGGVTPRAASNMLWAAKKLGQADPLLMAAAVEWLMPQVSEVAAADARALATCLWALVGIMRESNRLRSTEESTEAAGIRQLLAAAARPAASRIHCFDDQALSNLLWAYGTAGATSKRLMAAAEGELVRRAGSFSMQSLLTCVWAFVALGQPAPRLLGAVGRVLMERGDAELRVRLAECEEQGPGALVNLAWSYASLGALHRPLLSALMTHGSAEPFLSAYAGRDLSILLYSAAVLLPGLAESQPEALKALLAEVDRRLGPPDTATISQLVARDICMLSWSLAILSPSSPTLRRLLDAAVGIYAAGETDDGVPDEAHFGAAAFASAPATAAGDVEGLTDSDPSTQAAAGVFGFSAASAEGAFALNDTQDAGGAPQTPSCQQQEEQQGKPSVPYHLYSLAMLYGSNYAACLAEAEALNVEAGGSRRQECADSADGDGGANCVLELQRLAATAMRQAQTAAEGLDCGGRCTDGDAAAAAAANARAGPHDDAAAAAVVHGSVSPGASAESGRRGSVHGRFREQEEKLQEAGLWSGAEAGYEAEAEGEVVFGPLGACPRLFRAARNAWYLNSTKGTPSATQKAVRRALLEGSGWGGDGDGGGRGTDGDGKGAAGHGRSTGPSVTAVAEEVLAPNRMLRVDLLVLYDGWLVLLEFDGPSHFAVVVEADEEPSGAGGVLAEGPAAVGGAVARGDTVLRDRFLAAAVGLPRGRRAAARVGLGRQAGQASAAPVVDLWVVERLMDAFQAGLQKEGEPTALKRFEDSVREGAGMNGVHDKGSRDGNVACGISGQEGRHGSSVVRGVAVATLSLAEWEAAGEDKWGACLAPLLTRACNCS